MFIILFLLSVVYAYQSHESGINYLVGFNPITSEFLSPIFNWTYSMNKTSNVMEGIAIPDQMIERVNSETHFRIKSEIYKKSSDVKDLKDIEISASAKWKGIFGSYSQSRKSSSETFRENQHQLIRTFSKFRTHDMILLDNDNRNFHYLFTDPIYVVAKILSNFNDTNYDLEETINWNLDHLLRIVGPTYIWRASFGAMISLEQEINHSQLKSMTDNQIKKSASAGFSSIFKTGFNENIDHKTSAEFNQSVNSQKVDTYGGMPWTPNQTLDDYVGKISLRPTLIDYDFRQTVDLINGINFPNIDSAILSMIRHRFINRTLRFYQMNTVKGCLDSNSLNYCWFCNVEDHSCHLKSKHLKYGGIYRQGSFPQKNPWTQNYKCQSNYSDSLLYDGSYTHWEKYWTRECHHHWFHRKKCHDVPHNRGIPRKQKINICLSEEGSLNGYYFNGMYSNKAINVMTGEHQCSSDFDDVLVYQFSDAAQHQIRICQKSYDTVRGAPEGSVKFGGIFNCQEKNWLTKTYDCGAGYMKHPLGTFQGCDWFYCMGISNMTHKLIYYPPGYGTSFPDFPMEFLNQNTHTKLMMSSNIIQAINQDSDNHSVNGITIGILIGLFFVMIIFGCVLYLYFRNKKRSGYSKV